MAVLDFAGYSGPSAIELRLVVDPVAAGQIRVRLRANPPDGNTYTYYNAFTSGASAATYSITINGVNYSGTWTYDWRSPNQTTIYTMFDRTLSFTRATVAISGSSNGGATNLGSASVSATADTGYVPPVTTYTLSYNANGGSPTPGSQTLQSGASFTAGNAPSRSGYTFNYWSGSDGNVYFAGSSYSMPASNLSLTANWSLNPPPAPPNPTNLALTNRGQTSLTMSWSASSGATGYQVRNSTLTTTWTDVGSSLSYTFGSLTANTAYSLQVRAYTTGAGGTSNSGTATLNATTLPATFSTPPVVGQNFNTATTNLRAAGFSSVTQNTTTTGATSANNLLVRIQAPTSGTTATVGDVASIEYYNYLLQVPNILGQTQAEAIATLSGAGFPNRTFDLSDPTTNALATVNNNLLIASQVPTSGTQFNPVGTVAAKIYNFTTPVPNVLTQAQDAAVTALGVLGFTNITVILDEAGATVDNVNTVKSQIPVNSATTYNPKNQAVTLTVYSLGITGKRYNGTSHVPLSNAKRFTGTEWRPLTVQKRFNGTSWIDIAN